MFTVPAFQHWFPVKAQPWVYLLLAASFQLSAARYMGALNGMIGDESLMREDILMCLYANLAGMACYFPLLFRMKFRFTNKTLLRASMLGVLVTNLLTAYVSWLPLLWLCCFVEGMCKIQGTFECMSNVQLWITPPRDFRVFFPVLHLFIMGAQQVNGWGSAWCEHFGDWRLTHWVIAGLMAVWLLFQHICLRHTRIFPRTPLWGIDWIGFVQWAALVLQLAALLNYGDWLAWYKSDETWILTGTILITAASILWRMRIEPHAYISLKVFKFRHVVPILMLIALCEALLGTEYMLEEIYCEETLHYTDYMGAWRYGPALLGCWTGCGVAYWWMKMHGYTYVRLAVVGLAALLAYLVMMYFLISPDMAREQFFWPVFCRGFAATVLSIMFLVSLHDSMDFLTFFQGLSLFNMIHMVLGSLSGIALYARMFGWSVADAFGRYTPSVNSHTIGQIVRSEGGMSAFMHQLVEGNLAVGIKSIYGWAIFGCLVALAGFLMYDAPLRRHTRRMLTWRQVGKMLRIKS
ncbi:MAG: hypothetical protein K6E86_01450 [Bacteroidales bacterium]|nr:hypothetical protein [Bacteroidales bacterium]